MRLPPQLRFDVESGSQDAAAVDAGVALLTASSPRGALKRLFVLTDGFGSGGSKMLAAALRRAEAAGVEVVGVAVGLEPSAVPRSYGRWITAALPGDLPDALEALFGAEARAEAAGQGAAAAAVAAANAAEAAAAEWAQSGAAMGSGREEDVAALLTNQQRVFDSVLRGLSEWPARSAGRPRSRGPR
jgi:hypothetical protein